MAWNGSDQNVSSPGRAASTKSPHPAQGTRHKAQGTKHGILALLLIAALGGVAVWYFTRPAPPPPPAQGTKHKAQIASVTPAPARTNAVPAAVTNAVTKKKEMPTHRDAQGILRYETGQRAPDPTRKRRPVLKAASRERRIFKYASERMIDDLISSTPGEKRFFTPDYYDKGLEEEFLASLKEEIVINDDDMEIDKQSKRALIEARAEIKARMDAGEKFGDIMTETSKELQRLGEYSEELQEQVRKVIKDGKLGKNGEPFTEKEVRDLVGAANQMLEEKGCNPISEDSMIVTSIRLHADDLGWTSEERKAAVKAYREKRKAERAAAKKKE